MPQVDLNPLFTPPPKNRPSRPEPFLPDSWKDPRALKPGGTPSRLKLSLSQLVNIGFVLVACLGGVISALYFIRGGELFQEVSTWPRELFYGRPVLRPSPSPIAPGTKTSMDQSGDPFSHTSTVLSLNSPLNKTGPNGTPLSPSLIRGPFNRLSMPAPGGDMLSRSLVQSVPASAPSAGNAIATEGQAVASKVQQQSVSGPKVITGQTKTGSARMHSAGTKPKSRVSSRATGQISSQATGVAETTLPIKSNVAAPGSHIGAASPSVSATSSMSVGTSTGAVNHPAGNVGVGSGLNSVHGIGRVGGR